MSALLLVSSVIVNMTLPFSVVENDVQQVVIVDTTKQEELILDKNDIPALITHYAKEYNVDAALALNIACAESCMYDENGNIVFNPKAKNPNSSASGVFQFINGSWKTYCEGDVFDAEDNVKCAISLLATENGISHWTASKFEGFGGGWSSKPFTRLTQQK